ncbi:MAG: NUMOD4 domain-containing protein [Candidatus Nanoarchaeia archaeon]|nr:NUMOD4 domain-containing protein [Candidatus Nanoarchaeia archaeon]
MLNNIVNKENHVEQEIWKDIENYEGLYQVSNYGGIKSLTRKTIYGRRKNKIYYRIIKEKILKPQKHKNLYLCVTLSKNNIKKIYLVSRLVSTAFIPNTENKPQVNHIDGNKQNNYLWNLEWATCSENLIHAHKNGLQISLKGEQVGNAKLTEKQVLEIRNLYPKLNQTQLAKKYNVCIGTINFIVHRKKWKHI